MKTYFRFFVIFLVFICWIPHIASAQVVLIYTGEVNWITRAEAVTEAQTTKRLLQAADIQTEITQNVNAVRQWMLQTASDGSVNVLILYGIMPTTIYPPGNTMPDGSVAEKWIETRDGNTILNHADYLGYWSTGHIWNGEVMLQNLMDIPNISLFSGNDIPMLVTTDGSALTPSLVNFQSDRSFPLNQLRGDWYAEKILASNTGDARATLADPVIVRDGNRGRIAIVHQTELEDNPKGEVAAEIIVNYILTDVHISAGQRPPMYWMNTRSGTLHRLVGDEVENLVPNVRNATSLAIDVTDNKLYWTEKTSDHTGRIRRANLDGTNVRLVKNLTSVPHGIALDAAGDKIYLTNSWGKIQRLNVDGSSFQPNLITGLDAPRGVALDVSGGKVYWTEASGPIRRANLNGSNIEGIATSLGTPMNLIVVEGTVYWTEKTGANRGEIRFVAPGRNRKVVTRNTFTKGFPIGIALDTAENKLYWTTSSGEVGRQSLNGSNFQPNFITGLSTPGTFAVSVKTEVDTETKGVLTTEAILSILPSLVTSPAIGEQLTLNLSIMGGEAVAGYQLTLQFDPTALRYVGSSNGDYLPTDAFFVQPVVNRDRVELASSTLSSVSNGDGTLATITFEVLSVKPSTLTLSEPLLSDSQGNTFLPQTEVGEITEPPELKADVNGDGVVNIQDLVLVASSFGKTGQEAADVNADGVVNIADLVLVAGNLGTGLGAPPLHPDSLEGVTTADVRAWLSQGHQLNTDYTDYQRGLLVLEQLLAALTPKETLLLPNYPNPFNPETWIPYQLAEPGDVNITIYDARGTVVRRLVVGHQPAGYYTGQSRAAYWDGRNGLGEYVASGIYFYQLRADGVSLLRKMVTLK